MKLWQTVRPYLSGCVRFARISYLEVKSDNQGTHLGLLWVPLSTLIFTAMLALVFRHSDTMPLAGFFLYVLSGYVFWNFIAESISGSTDIIQKRLEFAIHNNLSLAELFGKLLVDRLFVYFLNLVPLVLFTLILIPENFGPNIFLFAPFLLLAVVTSLSVSYLINLLTVFFPDLTALIKVGTRFMFFASPVFWGVADGATGARQLLVQYNPAAYYLDLSRQVFGIQPFVGESWVVAAIISLVLCVIGIIAFRQSEGFVRNVR